MQFTLLGLIGLVLVADPRVRAVELSTNFPDWFASARNGELEIPPAVALKASTYRYIFVGGFRNERMPGYFVQNEAELVALGVPRKLIHRISPSSSRTTEQNAELVRERFLAIGAEGPEKLVVIAHSRGACDALRFAIADASFVRDRVEAMFLIQGPFGGSRAADYALGQGTPMDRRMPWIHRILGHLSGRVVRLMARRSSLEALKDLTSEASRDFWDRMLIEHADAVDSVGPRTYYICSTTEPNRLRFIRRAIAWYLKLYHGPSDGMVPLADQMLPTIGTVVATLNASHGDLTHRFPSTRTPRAMRKALIRSIFMSVGQAEASPSSLDLKIDAEPILQEDPATETASATVRK